MPLKLYILIPRKGSRFPAFMAAVHRLEDITLKEKGCVAWMIGSAHPDTPPGKLCNVENLSAILPIGRGPINCDHLVTGG